MPQRDELVIAFVVSDVGAIDAALACFEFDAVGVGERVGVRVAVGTMEAGGFGVGVGVG